MLDDLRLRQLDRALASFVTAKDVPRPLNGWVKAVREALGMSHRQLADRAGVSKTAATATERSEARDTVKLETLRKLAHAMECELVYALVPRDSLQGVVERQARRIATARVGRVSDSMELEAQGLEPTQREQQTDELAAEILRDRGRSFWDVRPGA